MERDASPGRGPREGRKHPWHRLHVCVSDYGATRGRPIAAGSHDTGEGLRDESDREGLPGR